MYLMIPEKFYCGTECNIPDYIQNKPSEWNGRGWLNLFTFYMSGHVDINTNVASS